MENTTAEKLFRALVVGGVMLASARAATACGPGTPGGGAAFDADTAGQLKLDTCTIWGAL